MTSITLLLWIVSGILLQLVIYLSIVYWRHWKNYQALPTHGDDPNPKVAEDKFNSLEKGNLTDRLGFQSFKVDRKVFENTSGSICSFYLIPEHGKPLPTFLPGQFLTFRLDVPTSPDNIQQVIRCYSLSDAPCADYYRITIKREPPGPRTDVRLGLASQYFHEHVNVGSILQVRAPCGHFHSDNSENPIVLIGGGIGITPLLSMLNQCSQQQPSRELWLFYGLRDGREMVMKSHLEGLASANPNFHLLICMSNPLPEDEDGRDYQHQGRVDIELLRTQLPDKPYHFYICGPTSMLESLVPALEDWGLMRQKSILKRLGRHRSSDVTLRPLLPRRRTTQQ
jgi:ferredoxin-NADP reductase